MAAHVRRFDDPASLARAVASRIAAAVQRVQNHPFVMALTGGGTIVPVYEELGREYPRSLWSDTHFCWSDERMVGREDPDSNYRVASDAWLNPAGVPPERIHHPDVGHPDPQETAWRYERDIRALLGQGGRLDCVLLSLGDDGHVASLFPGRPEVREQTRLVVAVTDSPKLPRSRITFTMPLLTRARQIHVLAVGASKADALALALGRPGKTSDRQRPPVAALIQATGQVEWWVDRAATGRLDRQT